MMNAQLDLGKLIEECDVVVENFRPGVLKRLGFDFPLLDAKNDEIVKSELLKGGGKVKVPCLYIKSENRFMYESNDIIAYLQGLAGVNS